LCYGGSAVAFSAAVAFLAADKMNKLDMLSGSLRKTLRIAAYVLGGSGLAFAGLTGVAQYKGNDHFYKPIIDALQKLGISLYEDLEAGEDEGLIIQAPDDD
ncbi:hypothetical protein ACFLY6_02320, partial [Candidatus Dependentiae bacterium]